MLRGKYFYLLMLILVFNNDAILYAISFFHDQNLDVLTGHAKIELTDFWSKVIMPFWDFFSIILDQNPVAVNNTGSNAAYLVGSFYTMDRKVLDRVGGFHSVRGAIKEDVELGQHIKRVGFKLKIARMNKFYSALWSRDFLSLLHGMGRTFLPMSKVRVFVNLLSLFFLAILPFLIVPYSISSYMATVGEMNFNHLLSSFILILNISSCLMIIIATALKDLKKYNISAIYSLLTFPAALLLISVYIANIVPLFLTFGRPKRVRWRDRTYEYEK